MNEYGDLTTEEFVKFFNGYTNASSLYLDEIRTIEIDDETPNEVDWVNKVA